MDQIRNRVALKIEFKNSKNKGSVSAYNNPSCDKNE